MGLRASPTAEALQDAARDQPRGARAAGQRRSQVPVRHGLHLGRRVWRLAGAAVRRGELRRSSENIRANLQRHLRATTSGLSLWEHANPQRPGYALGDEPGLLLCTWPRGGKPTLPFVYSDEVWTGHRVPGRLAPDRRGAGRRRPDDRQGAAQRATTGARATRGTSTSAATTTRAPWPATPCSSRSPASAMTPRARPSTSPPGSARGRSSSSSPPPAPGARSRWRRRRNGSPRNG